MRLFLVILIAVGLTLVFDARHFSRNYFSDSDKNKVINVIKSIGFTLALLGAVFVCTVFRIF
jgi:hypothetical protein